MDTTDQSVSNAPQENISDVSASEKETVAYETHRKLLSQRKNDQATIKELASALEIFKKAEAEAAERKAMEEGKAKEVIALKEAALKKTQEELESLRGGINRARKLNAFDSALGAQIKHEDFYSFVDTDSIELDTNGEPIKETVEQVVNAFKERYGDTLIAKKEVAKLPSDAPGNTTFASAKNQTTDWRGAINHLINNTKG